MDIITQVIAKNYVGISNAVVGCMSDSSLVTTKTMSTKNVESIDNFANNKSVKRTSYEPRKLLPNLMLTYEVVVVDPNCLYSSEDEDCDSSDGDVENSNEDSYQPKAPVHQKTEEPTSRSSELQLTESTSIDFSHEKSDGSPVKGRVELIDDLFDFVTLNIEDEDTILQEIKSFENDKKFDLAAYITDQSAPLILSPPPSLQLSPIEATECNHKLESNAIVHPMIHQPIEARSSKITSESSRKRKKLKREFLGDSSDSEDDCNQSKKRKTDVDPLWVPSEKQKIKSSDKVDPWIQTKYEQADKKDIHFKVPKCPVKNENSFDVVASDVKITKASKGIRHGVGRGKDIATLTKYYKNSTVYCSNIANADSKLMNGSRMSNRSITESIPSMKNVSEVKEQQRQQNGKKIESRSNGQKTEQQNCNQTQNLLNSGQKTEQQRQRKGKESENHSNNGQKTEQQRQQSGKHIKNRSNNHQKTEQQNAKRIENRSNNVQKTEQQGQQNGKQSDNRSNNGQDTQRNHKKSKHSEKEVSKNTNLSDFEKVIVASMSVASRKKPNETKRSNSTMRSRLNHFKEHPAQLKIDLSKRAAQSKNRRPLVIRDIVHPIPSDPISSKSSNTETVDKMKSKKVTEIQRKAPTEDSRTIKKNEQPTENCKISTEPDKASDLEVEVNLATKRKITLEEYLKRKVMQSA